MVIRIYAFTAIVSQGEIYLILTTLTYAVLMRAAFAKASGGVN